MQVSHKEATNQIGNAVEVAGQIINWYQTISRSLIKFVIGID